MIESFSKKSERHIFAALVSLIILQLVMLFALYFKTVPHPPEVIALFAIGPFLACSLSVACGALIVGPLGDKTGRILSVVAAIMALLSFGPQKYFDAQFGLIWPAVITGQVAASVIFYRVFSTKSSNLKKAQAA